MFERKVIRGQYHWMGSFGLKTRVLFFYILDNSEFSKRPAVWKYAFRNESFKNVLDYLTAWELLSRENDEEIKSTFLELSSGVLPMRDEILQRVVAKCLGKI